MSVSPSVISFELNDLPPFELQRWSLSPSLPDCDLPPASLLTFAVTAVEVDYEALPLSAGLGSNMMAGALVSFVSPLSRRPIFF